MSKYKYILRDYHAIKEAEIKLDGITVLSGINGCGKSTLSRWLYYLVNGSARFEEFLFYLYIDSIITKINRLSLAVGEIERNYFWEDINIQENTFYNELDDAEKEFNRIIYSSDKLEEIIGFVSVVFTKITIDARKYFLDSFSKEKVSEVKKKRVFTLLRINLEDKSEKTALLEFEEENTAWIQDISKNLVDNIRIRSSEMFFKLISKHYYIGMKDPINIQLSEDNVNILEDGYTLKLFNLTHAIYVDTPMSITSNDTNNIFWNDLRRRIIADTPDKANNQKLLIRIKRILGGETILNKDELSANKTLRFITADNKINILLKDVATGYKSFSYIQRLLENGELTSETLLMIDEPEAHLHPQWIVEFARILVMLHKEIGVKIMIASHNPDMIFAIQAIAKALGVIENTNFYLAEPYEGNPHQYVYRCLGQDIEDIFKSFNVAFDKINTYAGRSIGL